MTQTQADMAKKFARATLASAANIMFAGVIASTRAGLQKPRIDAVDEVKPETSRHAKSPEQISAKGWVQILKNTYNQIGEDRVMEVAGGVTFYGLLSLFPAITALVSIYGLFADRATILNHIGFLSSFMPREALTLISDQIQKISQSGDGALSFALIFGLGLALWSANAGMKSMIEALNIAYGVRDSRSFIKLNLQSLFMTLTSILALIVIVAAVAILPIVLNFISLGPVADLLVSLGRWPVLLAMLLLGLAVLYRYGPDRLNVKWRWVTPGSVFAGIGLVITSILFSWYAANFASYNETYGSLGAVIGFMTWCWLSATIVIIGAEVNKEVEDKAGVGGKKNLKAEVPK